VKGYFYGAFAWFSIPLGLCATMSYVAIGLANTEYWPIPGGITAYQINNSLILPLAAQAVMGKGGAVAVILMVFMAVTSSFSAEIIAHASIVTFDIYQPCKHLPLTSHITKIYEANLIRLDINPTASDARLKLVSHIALSFFAIFSASFATALFYSGISMGWILEFIGVVLGSAVIPITLAVNSAHASPLWMQISAPIGTACGMAAWLGTTKGMYGTVNVTTTFENWPMFAGCIVSLFVPLLLWLAMWPLHKTAYDWDRLFLMQSLQPRPGDKIYTHDDDKDLGVDWDPAGLARASRNAKIVSVILCLIFLIIIPFSLYGSHYIFSRKFFIGWTVVVFIWSWCAALLIWCLPIWEARATLIAVVRGIFGGKKAKGDSGVQQLEGKEIHSGMQTPEDVGYAEKVANDKATEI
jgi:hypothetical protein